MAQRILFTGDSITAGELGVGYLPLLAERFPECELVNLGQGGDTVSGIRTRTLAHLRENGDYDLVVIAAGHNDIILPEFERKSPIHRSIARSLARSGSVPASDYDSFLDTYRGFIDAIRQATGMPIVVVTMSCVNEDPASSTGQRRHLYNRGIRAVAEEAGVTLADVGLEFDRVLREGECRDYLMENLLALRLGDRWKSRVPERADRLSESRQLRLTIDGVHLNSLGAGIYAATLAPLLETLPASR
jgi:lysophospholipase L1-like esterase